MKLKVEHIGFEFSKYKILEDISFEVKENSFVGIIGPNGSGKSSLLKCIYGVNKPSKGNVFFEEENLLKMSGKERARRIAVLAQETKGQFDFKVKQVVEMGRYPHKKTLENYSKKDEEIVEKVLCQLNLEEYRERSFNTLSGGEKQRVLIARVLAQESNFIILDEPTNHLDIGYQIEIMNTIKSLGITVLAAIHDMNIASLYCDEIIVMKKGNVIKKGTIDEVMTAETLKQTFNVNAYVHHHERTGRRQVFYYP